LQVEFQFEYRNYSHYFYTSEKLMIRKLLIVCLLISYHIMDMNGQIVNNDECMFATFIPDVDDYCSEPMEFTNQGSTPSPQINPGCWPQFTNTNDVWYSFLPKNLGALIQLTGSTITEEGTLDGPAIAVYSGDCNSLTEEACNSVLFDDNVIELTMTDLTIGRLYYIRVDGRDNDTGSFKLCINTFSPVKSPESDCIDGVILCNKDEFFVEKIEGVGDDTNEVNGSCIQTELASVWYRWTCKDAGKLSFIITPNNKPDDIDFAVYELQSLDGCGSKRPIRCMASGETIGSSADFNSPCFGETGLSLTSNDLQEDPGCQPGDDNFVAAIDMQVGVSYALVINNFSQSGSGFHIQWGGSGTFLGPESDFIVDAVDEFECDKRINFFNQSSTLTDSIIGYNWSFGEGASPQTSNKDDSIGVVYASFGEKTAALTIESKRGCVVTKILDFYVEPCCQDTTTLDVSALAESIICPGDENGIIIANGISGAPTYQYSLDGENFQPNPRFINLGSGEYLVYVIDIKGCIDSVIINLDEPPPLIADAGPDQEIELGETTFLDGSYTAFGIVGTLWDGKGIIDSTTITSLDPEVFPFGTTTYTLTVTDQFGCEDTDEVTIRVRIVRPVYSPNALSPGTSTGSNDFFNLFGGPAVENVKELYVYDRWGNQIYLGEGLPINDITIGWDGKSNGRLVNPGVYTWYAKVLFIDGEVLPFSGDVTVFR
jgi:hypothetical protein